MSDSPSFETVLVPSILDLICSFLNPSDIATCRTLSRLSKDSFSFCTQSLTFLLPVRVQSSRRPSDVHAISNEVNQQALPSSLIEAAKCFTLCMDDTRLPLPPLPPQSEAGGRESADPQSPFEPTEAWPNTSTSRFRSDLAPLSLSELMPARGLKCVRLVFHSPMSLLFSSESNMVSFEGYNAN